MTLEELSKLEDEYYGKEDEDFEGGVMEDNYECAEWARDNMDSLFGAIRRLNNEVECLKKGIDKACYDITNEDSTNQHVLDQIHMNLVNLIKEEK